MGFEEQSRADKAGAQPPAAGDASAKFLGDLFEADPTDEVQVKAFNHGAHELKDLAGKQGFAINEAGFTEYLTLCNTFLDGYTRQRHDIELLVERAKMGSSPYALEIADHNVKVANGDEHSLIPNLDLMRDGYERLKEAFKIARDSYRETEAQHDQVFRKINSE